MGMFTNLGRMLSLLRELWGKSQARVAREADIGKSQLSKYENGKELPKLDSLEKVLNALEVGHFEFFYTLYLVDRRAAGLARADREQRGTADGPAMQIEDWMFPPLLERSPFLAEATDQAFSQVFTDLLQLYRTVFEQIVFTGSAPRTGGVNARAQAPPAPSP